jgi:hypothetical protein
MFTPYHSPKNRPLTDVTLQDDLGKKADVYTVKYFLSEPSKRDKASSRKSANNGKSTEANFKESLVEHKIGWLAKLDPAGAESSTLMAELTAESSKADQIQVKKIAQNIAQPITHLSVIKHYF